jgi:hypothetical protein
MGRRGAAVIAPVFKLLPEKGYICEFLTGSYVRSTAGGSLERLWTSWRFLRQKRPNVTSTAKNKKPPIAVPAMAAMERPGLGEAVDELEFVGPVDEVEVEPVLVDEGELVSRQLLSAELPTILKSELPPCLPCESIIINKIVVSWATFVFHWYSVGPTGGFKTNDVPPGIMPMMVIG